MRDVVIRDVEMRDVVMRDVVMRIIDVFILAIGRCGDALARITSPRRERPPSDTFAHHDPLS